ncbi:MAG: hypothetical protein DHS80DRAFT_24477 [Piptocephalis tieghemiana]|nr:MAG: hypothetical protein DHS80DRAFT_24477 [Piptocephalis tieghemiana]
MTTMILIISGDDVCEGVINALRDLADPIKAVQLLANEAKRPDLAESLLETCTEDAHVIQGYTTVILSECIAQRVERAVMLLKRLRLQGHIPEARAINGVVQAYIGQGKLQDAQDIFAGHCTELAASTTLKASVASSAGLALAEAYAIHGKVDQVDQVLEMLRSTGRWEIKDRVSPVHAIALLHTPGREKEGWKAFEKYARGLVSSPPTSLFAALPRGKRPQALSILLMYDSGWSRPLAHRALSAVLETDDPSNQRSRRSKEMGQSFNEAKGMARIQEALGILKVMRRAGVHPSSDTYQGWMLQYARQGDASGAKALKEAARRDHLVPDVHLWTTYINALRRSNASIESLEEAWKEMREVDKIAPSRITYNVLLEACAIQGQGRRALSWLKEMEDARDLEDRRIGASQGGGERRRLKALGRSIQPDFNSYASTLLAILGEAKEVGKTPDLLREAWSVFERMRMACKDQVQTGEVYRALIIAIVEWPVGEIGRRKWIERGVEVYREAVRLERVGRGRRMRQSFLAGRLAEGFYALGSDDRVIRLWQEIADASAGHNGRLGRAAILSAISLDRPSLAGAVAQWMKKGGLSLDAELTSLLDSASSSDQESRETDPSSFLPRLGSL